MKQLKRVLEQILFANKWLLVVFYFGLIIAQVMYSYTYAVEVWHMLHHATSLTKEEAMVAVLTLVDIAMVANLIKMIITGSYQVFVDKIPENTEKVSSGALKVKMGTSLVGVTSIHLLQSFISATELNTELGVKVGLHVLFLISALVLSQIDLLHAKAEYWDARTEAILHKIEHEKNVSHAGNHPGAGNLVSATTIEAHGHSDNSL